MMEQHGRPECVLVTGAGGFVGTWLLERLRPNLPPGSRILAVDRSAAGEHRLDIADQAAVDALVKRTVPSAIVHLAAISTQAESVSAGRRAWDVNMFGTMNLAEATMRHAPQARFVFVGSSEAYGASFKDAGGALDESAVLAPRTAYAATKAAADLVIGQMAAAGLRAVRFRPFNHTGPGQSDRFVVPAFAAQIAAIERGERAPVIKVGNLDVERDFLDVRDVVAAYSAAVVQGSWTNGSIFNLASGVPRRIGDVLDALLAMSSVRITIEIDASRQRPSDTAVAFGDARHAEKVLGWRPVITWEATLRDVLEWYRRRVSGDARK